MIRKFFCLPEVNPEYINRRKYFLLFETSLFNQNNLKSYIFVDPIDVIKINDYRHIKEAFLKIEKYSKKYYIAGYFSYELGYYFEENSFSVKPASSTALIYLSVFEKAASFNHKTGKLDIKLPDLFIRKDERRNFYANNLRFNLEKSEYINRIRKIKEYIRRGETYQVNFTGKFYFDFKGSAFSFYRALKNKQKVSYGAFLKLKDEYVISLSPELYFRKEGRNLCSQPMKGTIERGRNNEEDEIKHQELKNSNKDLAENLMIADLERNDLGRISEFGSVKAVRLFNIERYDTLFQMTSVIKSTLKKNITYFDIFRNVFPGGSVTGAPKIRTMQIIKELETGPRGVYCGALGIIFPQDKAVFNIPIRTVYLNKKKGEMGVGSGIVIDSSPEKEFQECSLKARFLTEEYKEFRLIETILWDYGYKFLKEHIKRLKDSAKYFDFYFYPLKIISGLKKLSLKFNPGHKYKIRLLLSGDGKLKLEYSRINDVIDSRKYIAVSKHGVDSENLFLYHKTTNRDLYDSESKYYSIKGYFDVIFLNTRNEITEGAISNIIIEKYGKRYTPPLSCGLLGGIYRQFLIDRRGVEEKIIYLDDLHKADKIFLCNSVRGLTQVDLKKKI